MNNGELLDGWFPYRLHWKGRIPYLQWFYAGDRKFTDPFFADTVSKCLSLEQNAERPSTSAEEMIAAAEASDEGSSVTFIYHISRCGSTMLTQMLAEGNSHAVLSEVPLLDDILRCDLLNDETKRRYFTAVLRLLGRSADGKSQHIFVKTDSWHVLFHAQLKEWFPQASFVLMTRSVREVASSQLTQPAMHSVAGVLPASLFGLTEETAAALPREAYLEHVLTSYLMKYREILAKEKEAVLINYHDGAARMLNSVLSMPVHAARTNNTEEMLAKSKYYSKSPDTVFRGDENRVAVAHDYRTAEELHRALIDAYCHHNTADHAD